MNLFPNDPKKLKARIRSYERALKARDCDDGYGKRFLVGTMYLLLGDTEGALRYFAWYTKRFPDDGTEPLNHLSWALALYRSGDRPAAEEKLRKAAIANLHIWDWLHGGSMERWDIWYSSNFAMPEYLTDAPPEILDLWEPEELEWAHEFSMSAPAAKLMEEVVALKKRLKTLRPGIERSGVVERLYSLR